MDFEALAMYMIETNYPDDVNKLDELYDKDNDGTITTDERVLMKALDTRMNREFQRIQLHYRLNWPSMDKDVKRRLYERANKWKKEHPPK